MKKLNKNHLKSNFYSILSASALILDSAKSIKYPILSSVILSETKKEIESPQKNEERI